MNNLLTNTPESLNELKSVPHWVAWKFNEERKKIPVNPRNGKNASSSTPATWTDFDTAIAFDNRMGYTARGIGGVGFMFGAEPSGFAGIDIDDCVSPDGKLSDMAADIVNVMDSYTEYSVSGTGIHILFRLNKPLSEIGNGNRNDKVRLEIYDKGRYFVMTGNVCGQVRPIADRTEALTAVYEKYMPKPEVREVRNTPTVDNKPKSAMTIQGNGRSEDLSDDALWERMFASAKGDEIRALHNGDTSGYGNDDSRADLALCSYLAWWTHGDKARIDRMFRQSGLMREKWDERHGAQTYGEMTIAQAMNNTYQPLESVDKSGHVRKRQSPVMAESQLSTVGVLDVVEPEPASQDLESRLPMTGFDYVAKGLFDKDLEIFQKFPPVMTGLKNLDDAQKGFLPGLYILGAVPSLGKTSFLSQVADNMAGFENPVLFFSLEQSRLEMTTKSISRLTARLDKRADKRNAVTSINIRRGDFISDSQRELVDKAVAEYQKFSRYISIIEGNFNTNVETIVQTVEQFISITGLRPVVIIDYLQIVQPTEEFGATRRDAIDSVISRLKTCQRDNCLVLIGVSSFNRGNYNAAVDYSSFKESSQLEYTCDCMWGLQPQVMVEDLFQEEKATRKQRKAFDKAVKATPRKVMLKNLKNRYGKCKYSCGFVYDPRFDLFDVDETFKENDHD